ncbi:MAG TPA: hypothetical protein VMQ83_09790 [Gammaproteobacteria bacterium]|nr:hypothetical protein [Gammaproteobacteria bacterium]
MSDESEALERAAIEDIYRAAPAGVAVQLGLRPFNSGGAFVSLAGGLPPGPIVVNRVIGLELGCRKLLTCTGEAVPGDPQHSYRNILKAGFRESYVRDNYALPAA